MGPVKRVGDGSSIWAWVDPWIPSNHGFKHVVKLSGAPVNRVEELIDVDNGELMEHSYD